MGVCLVSLIHGLTLGWVLDAYFKPPSSQAGVKRLANSHECWEAGSWLRVEIHLEMDTAPFLGAERQKLICHN